MFKLDIKRGKTLSWKVTPENTNVEGGWQLLCTASKPFSKRITGCHSPESEGFPRLHDLNKRTMTSPA